MTIIQSSRSIKKGGGEVAETLWTLGGRKEQHLTEIRQTTGEKRKKDGETPVQEDGEDVLSLFLGQRTPF